MRACLLLLLGVTGCVTPSGVGRIKQHEIVFAQDDEPGEDQLFVCGYLKGVFSCVDYSYFEARLRRQGESI